jgi:CRP-like cAMP-binding protein
MVIDLAGIASDVTANAVIYAALAFFSGMAGVMLYHRLAGAFQKRDYHADDGVIEGVVQEYSRRLRDYDRMIADLRTKVDILELRAEPPAPAVTSGVISHQTVISQAPQHHARVILPAAVTQHVTSQDMEKPEGQNGTTDYVLKMLAERPRTSREVQQAIGRSREHTSRLMKKLAASGLVDRDASTKPFRYAVTDSGRERLKEKVASEMRSL